MNKAAAAGFALGVLVLVAVVALSGRNESDGRAGTVSPKKVTRPSAANDAAQEESEESSSGTAPASRKIVDFKPERLKEFTKAIVEAGELKMSRSADEAGYVTGKPLDLTITLDFQGKEKVTALAIVEKLPKGWSFDHMTGEVKPVIVPAKGAMGDLTFVWVQVPAFPCVVSYRIIPAPEVAGTQELSGQAVYRLLGPERRTEMVVTMVNPAQS